MQQARETEAPHIDDLPWRLRRGLRRVIWQQVQKYFQHGIEVRPGDTVIDVGAHVGCFAIEVLRRTEGRATLTCIEPAPETHAAMLRNVGEVFPDADIEGFCCALSSTNDRATLYYRPNVKVLTSLYPDLPGASPEEFLREIRENGIPGSDGPVKAWWLGLVPDFVMAFLIRRGVAFAGKAQAIECETRTLSSIMEERGIERVDLLKVDVEGAELEVLRGIEQEDWPKIESMVLEVHDEDGRVQAILDMLAEHGFEDVVASQGNAFKRFYNLFARRTRTG